jgi:hypothetical protein
VPFWWQRIDPSTRSILLQQKGISVLRPAAHLNPRGGSGLNPRGNRQINHALHIAAIVQIRYDGPGRSYYLRKLEEGKTPKEAIRALKRQISDAVYKQLRNDSRA